MRRLTSDCNQYMFMRHVESDKHQVQQLADDCEHYSITREFESEIAYENSKK